jgi:hypothetical protein
MPRHTPGGHRSKGERMSRQLAVRRQPICGPLGDFYSHRCSSASLIGTHLLEESGGHQCRSDTVRRFVVHSAIVLDFLGGGEHHCDEQEGRSGPSMLKERLALRWLNGHGRAHPRYQSQVQRGRFTLQSERAENKILARITTFHPLDNLTIYGIFGLPKGRPASLLNTCRWPTEDLICYLVTTPCRSEK